MIKRLRKILSLKSIIAITSLLILAIIALFAAMVNNANEVFSATLGPVDPLVRSITFGKDNVLYIKLKVTDKESRPVEKIYFNAAPHITGARIFPEKGFTDEMGIVIFSYYPPDIMDLGIIPGKLTGKYIEKVEVKLKYSKISESPVFTFSLVPSPVILIPGYQSPPSMLESLSAHLKKQGFMPSALSYESADGVKEGAFTLSRRLTELKALYHQQGLQTGSFSLIGHSMGGLVARYLTSDPVAMNNTSIDRMIFLSVPHNGSPVANLGLKYYNDQGIMDLLPESSLIKDIFPGLLNKGLNRNIRVGNLLGQYDEVVSLESASLTSWGIKTELFNVGESNFTIEKLMSGQLGEASNHKAVLYNKKVYSRIIEMLTGNLPYPLRIN